MPQHNITRRTDPAALVAIIIAARRSGDCKLERAARSELRDEHRVELRFVGLARPTRTRKRA